jgi:hypothetical protein
MLAYPSQSLANKLSWPDQPFFVRATYSSYSLRSEAWQAAVETHLATLTQSQRAAFQAPSGPDDCMSIIAKSHRRRGFTRVLEAMRPVLEPLRRFESVIDVVVRMNGGIGSPIWGPLKHAIMVEPIPNC